MISEELPTICGVDRIMQYQSITVMGRRKTQVKLIRIGDTWINAGRWIAATPENIDLLRKRLAGGKT